MRALCQTAAALALVSWFDLCCLLALAGVGLGAAPALALDPERKIYQYSLRSWSVEDGLPQNTIQAIAQTPEGYLWLATYDGLVRSDGIDFEVFDRSNTPELVSTIINDLRVGADGTLWVASDDGVVSWKDGRFERHDRHLDTATRRVLKVVPATDGRIWFGSYGGLGWFRGDSRRIFGPGDGLKDNSIWAATESTSGRIWIGTYVGGLFYSDSMGLRSQALVGPPIKQGIKALVEDASGDLWAGSSIGLHRLADGQSRLFGRDDGLAHEYVRALVSDRDGNLWVGTFGGGLHRLQEHTSGEVRIEHYRDQGMGDVRIISLFEDREGNLWMGSQGRGLFMLSEGPFVTFRLMEDGADQQATSIYQDAEDGVWVATHSEGIRLLRPDGSESHFPPGDVIPALHLWSVLGDRQGNLWIGTSGDGLARYRDGRFDLFGTEHGLPHDVVFDLHEGRDGSLWIGTNGGLARYHEGTIEAFGVERGLSSNLIRAVVEDGAGNLWVGTSGGGLNRYQRGEFEHFGIEEGLGGNNVWAILEDSRGWVWFATSGGLSSFVDGRLVTLDSRHGLQSDNLMILVEDGAGNLWVGSKGGIMRLDRNELESFFTGRSERVSSLRYGDADGLRNTELVGGIQPSAWRARDGKLWFPTPDGVAVVDPKSSLRPSTSPAPIIEKMWADDRLLDSTEGSYLESGTKRLEIEYTALDLHAPHMLRFRYRLVGFDTDWIEAGHQRRAIYTNLPPGDFVFEVASRSEDGDWSRVTSSAIELLPYLHQTLLFQLTAVSAFLLLFFGGVRWRLAAAERREAELAERVDEALRRVKTLHGMLPICSSCKKVRDDDGYWNQLEVYLAEQTDALFSHSLCPDCGDRYLRQLDRD